MNSKRKEKTRLDLWKQRSRLIAETDSELISMVSRNNPQRHEVLTRRFYKILGAYARLSTGKLYPFQMSN